MNNQTSIKYISSLLEHPETITEGDSSSIALFRQTFPYFVPSRYLVAMEGHKKKPYSPQMLSAIQPYLGDWILFSEFLENGSRPVTELPVNKVVDKKMAEVQGFHPLPMAPLPVVLPEAEQPAPAPVPELPQLSFAPVIAVVDEMPPIPVVSRMEEAIAVNEPILPSLAEMPKAETEYEAPLVLPEPVIETGPAVQPPAPVIDVMTEPQPALEPVSFTPTFTPPAPEIADVIAPEQPYAEPVPVFEPPVAVAPVGIEPLEPVSVGTEEDADMAEPVNTVEAGINQMQWEPMPDADQLVLPVPEIPVAAVLPGAQSEVTVQPEESAVPETSEIVPNAFKDPVEDSAFARAWAEMESNVVEDVQETEIEEAVEIVNETLPGEDAATAERDHDPLIFPIYTRDYFLQQGEKVSDEIPLEINELKDSPEMSEEDKSLMVVMSFSEWLLHFKNSAEKQREESKDQKALKTMWQKEKLAAAMEEENEEIPETVFEMAVNSISKEEGLISETLAEIHIKQGKYDKAIEMYRKLSLKNPQKSVYFARKIDEALKDKQS